MAAIRKEKATLMGEVTDGLLSLESTRTSSQVLITASYFGGRTACCSPRLTRCVGARIFTNSPLGALSHSLAMHCKRMQLLRREAQMRDLLLQSVEIPCPPIEPLSREQCAKDASPSDGEDETSPLNPEQVR